MGTSLTGLVYSASGETINLINSDKYMVSILLDTETGFDKLKNHHSFRLCSPIPGPGVHP